MTYHKLSPSDKEIWQELKETLELYETLAKITRELIYDYDVKSGKIKWSGSIEEITGYTNDHFQQFGIDGWGELIHPEDQEEAFRLLKKSEQDCSTYDVEYRFRKNDGSYIHIEDHGIFIPDADKKAFRMVGTMNDITDRKVAQEALRESEERYRNLVELSPDAIVVHSEGKLVFVNSSAAKMLKATDPEEIMGKSMMDFVHAEYKDLVVKRVQSMFESGAKVPLVHEKFVRLDGTVFDAEVAAMPFTYRGKPAYQVVIRDISERRLSEEALKESEFRYRTLFERIPVGLYRTSISGEVIEANPALIKILGYNHLDEIIRIKVTNFYADPADRERLSERLQKDEVVIGYEAQIKRPDGSIIWGRDTSRSIKDENGKVLYFEGSLVDITTRKNIEKELIKAKEIAEESDRLKSAFLANISHEIRTPMNGIIGFTELLQNKDLNESKKNEYISVIDSCSHQLLKLMNDIIDISKIEAGLIEYNKARVCINELLDELFDYHKASAIERNLKLTLIKSLENYKSCILTDEQKLRQVLNNIISNAIKFTQHGTIEIGYVFRQTDIEFFVKDTGMGIPEEIFDLIFQRFNQPKRSFQKQYSGTGLGLSISKAYVELMGGKIWLESKPGKGSTFYFSLPYNLVETDYSKVASQQSQEEKIFNWEKKKILIVEDEVINYLYLKELLRNTGATILCASNGLEAVEACKQHKDLSLVIMDMKMPGMSGYEAIPLIKKIRNELPVLALSAYALSDDVKKAYDAGCDNFLAKPVITEELFEMINKYI